MKKIEVCFRAEDLRALRRIATQQKRSVASLIREAVQEKWLKPGRRDSRPGYSLIGLYDGPVPKGFSSEDHAAAFDASLRRFPF
jgi:hypothetical protein